MSYFIRCLAQNQAVLNSNALLIQRVLFPSITCLRQQRRGLLTTKKEVSRDFLAYIQQEIDLRPVAIRRWKKKKQWEMLVKDHEWNPERVKFLGCDLAIAHFIIARGGAIRFCDIDMWFEGEKPGTVPSIVPNVYEDGYRLEAIDASDTTLMYCSFDNIEPVPTLRYLDMSNCQYIDDWCLDRLSSYRHSLEYLDISGCQRITQRGLATLHRMSKLKRLCVKNLPKVRDRQLIGLMLEEALPNTVIEGIDCDTDLSDAVEEQDETENFEIYEKKLLSAIEAEVTGRYFQVANIRF